MRTYLITVLALLTTALAEPLPDRALSDMTPTTSAGAWGPVEKDHSNGEQLAGDGGALTLPVKTTATFARGLGVNAPSEVVYPLDGACATFSATVGVDAETGGRGSVVFQVVADGETLYDSGVVTGADLARTLKVDVAGKKELRLIVTDAGDGKSFDHADWAAPTLSGCELVYSAPLVITRGGTYTGNWESKDPSVPAVSVKTSEPVVIENANVRGPGNLIVGSGNRLTVRSSYGYGVRPQQADLATGNFVHLGKVISLDVENNTTDHLGLVYVNHWTGSALAKETIRILYNKVGDVDGRRSDGQGGYLIAGEQKQVVAHAILFNAINRIPGAEIAWNEIVNEPGNSMVSDNINMYGSSGTPDSPILIHDNYVQGGYNPDPASDKVYSGGGIILGDGKRADPLDFGYARVFNNQVVSTTNYGIAIVGGVHQEVDHNRVVSSGLLPDGRPIVAQNVGIYVWDINGQRNLTPPTFAFNSVHDNLVGWTKVRADGSTSPGETWLPQASAAGGSATGFTRLGVVTPAFQAAEYDLWLGKLRAAGVSVGAP